MSNNMKLYELAEYELKRFFDSINNAYNISEKVNPIEHIKHRIKKLDSIEYKLLNKGYSVTEENIGKYIKDVVGFRIVCSFMSDLEQLKNMINKLDKDGVLQIVEIKDYVKNPKEDSGYSSYHILVKVPVNYNNEVRFVDAEIQLRTIAMDMSASLEHKLCYKKEGYSENLRMMAREATNFCRSVDLDLDRVVESVNNKSTSDNKMFTYPFMNDTGFNLFKLKYEEALNFVNHKFEMLNDYYYKSDMLNPIEHIKSRIKNNNGIIRKLIEKDRVVSIDNIERYVNDFAGVRIVCSFLSDLEELKQYVQNDSDFEIIEEKDYVTYPKESGYRGYHFLVKVPVYTLDGVKHVKVEIQLRTIAMEMWASLEEKIAYHKEPDEKVVEELHRISSITSTLDNQFNIIYAESKKQQSGKVRKLVR